MANQSIADLAAYAKADIQKFLRDEAAIERKARTAARDREWQTQVKKNAPLWDRWHAERDLGDLVKEVVSTGQVTDDHKATYGRLSKHLGEE